MFMVFIFCFQAGVFWEGGGGGVISRGRALYKCFLRRIEYDHYLRRQLNLLYFARAIGEDMARM